MNEFGDFMFSGFGSIVRTDKHTHRDADERFTLATLIGVSKYVSHVNTRATLSWLNISVMLLLLARKSLCLNTAADDKVFCKSRC